MAAEQQIRRLVVICRDTSPSMGGEKGESACEAAGVLLQRLAQDPTSRIHLALIDFDSKAEIRQSPVPAPLMASQLMTLQTSGDGTDLGLALSAAARLTETSPFLAEERPLLILVTDGHHNAGPDPRPVARRLHATLDIVTLSTGRGSDESMLRQIVSAPHLLFRCGEELELLKSIRMDCPSRLEGHAPRSARFVA